MDIGNSSLYSGAKIKLIASLIAEEYASKVQDYETILVFFMNTSSGCEVLIVSTL